MAGALFEGGGGAGGARSPTGGRLSGAAALAATLLSASLAVLAFPPFGLWPLVFLAPAPLLWALEGRRPRAAFALGLVHGLVLGLGVVRWLLVALVDAYGVPRPVAWLVLFGVVAPYAAVHALAPTAWAVLAPRLRLGGAPLVFAALAGLAGWLRAVPLGLPWILTAHALAPALVWLAPASWGGALLAGLVPTAVGAGLGLAGARRRALPLVAPALLAAAVLGHGWATADDGGPEPDVRVGVVQAAVPPAERFQPGSARRHVRAHAALTRRLAAREPRLALVVWPETAVDAELGDEPGLAGLLRGAARAADAPLLTGAVVRDAEGPRNAVLLVRPGRGIADRYAKQKLVPVAESDPPLQEWLRPLLAPVMEGEAYAPGREATVFRAPPLRLSTPVCFEITDAELVRRFLEAGAELLVNLSNDAWFGRSGYAELHFAHAVIRAVEHRTWVVRAANTGLSGVVAPSGRVVARLGLEEEGTLAADVAARRGPTLYARTGDAPWVAAFFLGAVVGAWSGRGPAAGAEGSSAPAGRAGRHRGSLS